LAVLTTNQLGVIAESAIAPECAHLGGGVSRPLDDERYDLILDPRSSATAPSRASRRS
jgi:hypothetical protein